MNFLHTKINSFKCNVKQEICDEAMHITEIINIHKNVYKKYGQLNKLMVINCTDFYQYICYRFPCFFI